MNPGGDAKPSSKQKYLKTWQNCCEQTANESLRSASCEWALCIAHPPPGRMAHTQLVGAAVQRHQLVGERAIRPAAAEDEDLVPDAWAAQPKERGERHSEWSTRCAPLGNGRTSELAAKGDGRSLSMGATGEVWHHHFH